MLRVLIFLALLAFAAPALATGNTCTITGTNGTAQLDGTALTLGGGGDLAYSGASCSTASAAGDSITIEATEMDVSVEWLQDTTADAETIVASGATLRARVCTTATGCAPSTAPIRLEFARGNDDFGTDARCQSGDCMGIIVQEGGSLALRGGFREWRDSDGDASAGEVFPVAQKGSNTRWFIGQIVPCGDGDCSTNDDRVRFSYPDATYDPTATGYIGDAIGAINVGGEAVAFVEPYTIHGYVPAEHAHQFTIVATSGDVADPWIEVDVRQGTRAETNYPLSMRDIVETTATADAEVGQRTLTVATGTLPNGSGDFEHRWLWVGDGSGGVLPRPIKILRTTDGAAGADTLQFGDPRGLPYAISSGATLYIGYGFEEGDPFHVLVPAIVSSSTTDAYDTRVEVQGTLDADGFWFEGVNEVQFSGEGVRIDAFRHWRHFDSGSGESTAIIFNDTDDIPDFTVEWGSFTFGDVGTTDLGSSTGEDDHGFIHEYSTARPNATYRDIAVRYHGDDPWANSDVGAGGNGKGPFTLTAERIHCGRYNGGGGTFGCMDFQSSFLPVDVTINATEIVCSDCTDDHIFTNDPLLDLKRGVFWASKGKNPISTGGTSEGIARAEELLIIGGGSDASTVTWLTDLVLERWAMFWVEHSTAGVSMITGAVAPTLTQGLVVGNKASGHFINFGPHSGTARTSVHTNNVFWDNFVVGDMNLFQFSQASDADDSVALRHNVVGWSPDASPPSGAQIPDLALGGTASATAGETLDAFTILGHRGATVTRSVSVGTSQNIDHEGGWCLFDNLDDGLSFQLGEITGDGGTLSRGEPCGLMDPARWKFRVRPNGEAASISSGIEKPAGLTYQGWALGINKLRAEDFSTRDGGEAPGGICIGDC